MHFNKATTFLRYFSKRAVLPTLLLLMIAAETNAQTATKHYYTQVDVTITKERKQKSIFTKVDIKEPFPGGDSAWIQRLEKNLDQSIREGKRIKKGIYVVSVRFIVSKDGTLSDIKCITDHDYDLCSKIIRAIRGGPSWRPAKQREGSVVRERDL
jgi:hypothetical protein